MVRDVFKRAAQIFFRIAIGRIGVVNVQASWLAQAGRGVLIGQVRVFLRA